MTGFLIRIVRRPLWKRFERPTVCWQRMIVWTAPFSLWEMVWEWLASDSKETSLPGWRPVSFNNYSDVVFRLSLSTEPRYCLSSLWNRDKPDEPPLPASGIALHPHREYRQ